VTARAAAAGIARRLSAAGVPEATFEAELLTRESLGIDRSSYFAGAQLGAAAHTRLETLAARRAAREPAAYITGRREFYGLEFAVSPGVLIPRPETEMLVELTLAELRERPGSTVVDVGTGSGCVAVAIACHAPQARVFAVDRSPQALEQAVANARRHKVRIEFVLGDLIGGLRATDIVVANLPYIPTGEIEGLEPEIRDWEPRVALDGGPDGLELIRALVAVCGELRPSLLAVEVGLGQADRVVEAVIEAGASPEVSRDLAGIERVVSARWR
jgi:release factor glutamine methyltransferase